MDGTTARVSEAPKCAFCDKPAKYDAATKTGQWAYVCEDDWIKHRAFPTLGTGKGQRLVIASGPTGRKKPKPF